MSHEPGPSRLPAPAAHLHRMDITRITDTDTGTRTVHTRNSVFTIDVNDPALTDGACGSQVLT